MVALPAFIASWLASRPLVEEMCRHAEEEGFATTSQCMAAYDERTRAAADRWAATVPTRVHQQAQELIEAASAAATRRWRNWCEASDSEPEESHVATPQGSMRPGTSVGPDAGMEDQEHPAAQPAPGAPKLQSDLVRIADSCVA